MNSIIYLYNSLQKSELSKYISRLLCSIRHGSESEMKIISKPVQQHLNGFDCGVYDPASLFYDRQEMRKHLLRYLQRGDLEPYPNSSKEPTVVNQSRIAFNCIATIECLSLAPI